MDHVNFTQKDRDLLTELNVQVLTMKGTIEKLDKTVSLLNEKLNSDIFVKRVDYVDDKEAQEEKDKDYELRLRRLEWWGALAAGGLFILQLLLK